MGEWRKIMRKVGKKKNKFNLIVKIIRGQRMDEIYNMMSHHVSHYNDVANAWHFYVPRQHPYECHVFGHFIENKIKGETVLNDENKS